MIAIAYISATIFGDKIKRMGIQKYVGRIKEYSRLTRRYSSFYVCLYGQTWINFIEQSWDCIIELMTFNRNKRKYYQRGLRAMSLVLSTF